MITPAVAREPDCEPATPGDISFDFTSEITHHH